MLAPAFGKHNSRGDSRQYEEILGESALCHLRRCIDANGLLYSGIRTCDPTEVARQCQPGRGDQLCPTGSTDSTDIRTAAKNLRNRVRSRAIDPSGKILLVRAPCRWRASARFRAARSAERCCRYRAKYRKNVRSAPSTCIPASSACILTLPAVSNACSRCPNEFHARTSGMSARFMRFG